MWTERKDLLWTWVLVLLSSVGACLLVCPDILTYAVQPGAVAARIGSGMVIVDDPSFVTLTAVPNTAPGADAAFNLEVRANNPAMPVEVSYLITSSTGTPTNPVAGVKSWETSFPPTLDPGKQYYFHTEVGGWGEPQFRANPQYFPLPHYRTCVLMLARYEKIYVVFLRENDGQITYKLLVGGPFTGLILPELCQVTRQGSKFEVRSLGGPVEVGLWAKGEYLHDEVAGWGQPQFRENPKYYEIPHYGMFMLMVGRCEKLGLIIGNENDGRLGAVVLTGWQAWTTETVAGLCQVSALIPRTLGAAPKAEVRAFGSSPVEVSHFAFDDTCWQWEVNGWARPEFAPNPQILPLKHYTPGFLMVSRYDKVGLFFYNENDGHLGVVPLN